MPNNDYDDLFDQWGSALNVNPQLAKTVFHVESSGKLDVPDNEGAVGPMQIKPETARAAAVKLGFDPDGVNLHDMRWAVPIGMQVLADGLNATKGSPEGALGYYSTGSADPHKWSQDYLAKADALFPDMTLIKRPSGDNIANTAASQTGQDGAGINAFLQAHGQSLDARRNNWCAAFVNGVLDANGVEGTTGEGKNIATGFLNWGQSVDGTPQPGDVLVQPKGHPAGGLGGHVGIATGHVADGADGKTYYLMESGNMGGKVQYSWEPSSTVVVRRAPGLRVQANAQQ